tara:strand:+ start:480 stop:680 length:201 start_codon:yes stop_codon:yes gene_type:complete
MTQFHLLITSFFFQIKKKITNFNEKHIKMVHRWQLGVSCGILTAVWTNLYVNYTRLQIAKDKKEDN